MAVIPFAPEEITQSVRYDPLTKRASVYDVIRLIMGCDAKQASNMFHRLQDRYPELSTIPTTYMQFPGRGQRRIPVAHIKELIEIAWLCPGKHALEFRQNGAATLCRVLGGDPALVDEIRARWGTVSGDAQEALLAGTGVSVAQANGRALVDPEEAQLRKRERLASVMVMEANAHKTMLAVYDDMMAKADAEDNPRDKLFFKDAARNYVRKHFQAPGQQLLDAPHSSRKQMATVQEVAHEMGMKLTPRQVSNAGKEAVMIYRHRYGEEPPKVDQLVNGAVVLVNCYPAKDRELVQKAIEAVME